MENINSHMKNFTDLVKQTAISISESLETSKTVDDIYTILERTEKILNRKLTNEEFNQFTDLLVEEEMGGSTQQKQEPIFKKAKYVVEIMTSRGKVTRTASSQKGLLDVIHGQTNFVVTQDGKNITTKVKAFIKERQSQQRLKKEMMKKLKESEESTSNFFFNELIENQDKKKREEQTQTRVFADDYEKRIMAAVNAIQDPNEREQAAKIAAEQIALKKAGGRIAPEKRPEPDPKYFDKDTGEFVNPATGKRGLRQKQRLEFDPNLSPVLDPGKVVTYTPMPTRLDFNYDEGAYQAALSSWTKSTKEQADKETKSTTASEFPKTYGRTPFARSLFYAVENDPVAKWTTLGAYLTPAAPFAATVHASAGASKLRDQAEEGQFTGEAPLNVTDTIFNVASVLPFVGTSMKAVSRLAPRAAPIRQFAKTGSNLLTIGSGGAALGAAGASNLTPSAQPQAQQVQQKPVTRFIEREPEYVPQEGDFILPVETRRKLEVTQGPNRRII